MAGKKADITDLVARYQKARAAGKRAYARADDLITKIAALVEPGQEIELRPGVKAVLVDQFADKLVVWTPCGAHRWKIETKVVAS